MRRGSGGSGPGRPPGRPAPGAEGVGAGRLGEVPPQHHGCLGPAAQLHQFPRRLDHLLLGAEPADQDGRHDDRPRHQPDHRHRRQHLQGRLGLRRRPAGRGGQHDDQKKSAQQEPDARHPLLRQARLQQRGHVQKRTGLGPARSGRERRPGKGALRHAPGRRRRLVRDLRHSRSILGDSGRIESAGAGSRRASGRNASPRSRGSWGTPFRYTARRSLAVSRAGSLSQSGPAR